jgi:DNA-binding NarL/FixJ family response regulator
MRTIMSANGTRPARLMIIDDHEITRAACRALLRTEGADVVADMAAGDQAIAAAAALRPDVVVVDVSPVAGAGFGLARRLHALPHPPAVVLTSSADPAEFGTRLGGHSFVAKAGLCAEAIDAAVCRASLGGCRRTGHGR